MVILLNNIKFPLPKDALYHVWLKLAQWFWRITFFKIVNFVNIIFFSQFHHYPPVDEHGPFIWIPFHSRIFFVEIWFVEVWVKLTQWFWRRLFKCVNVFFAISQLSPLGKRRTLHLNKLNFLHLKMICAKFGWNWPSGSGEEDF